MGIFLKTFMISIWLFINSLSMRTQEEHSFLMIFEKDIQFCIRCLNFRLFFFYRLFMCHSVTWVKCTWLRLQTSFQVSNAQIIHKILEMGTQKAFNHSIVTKSFDWSHLNAPLQTNNVFHVCCSVKSVEHF